AATRKRRAEEKAAAESWAQRQASAAATRKQEAEEADAARRAGFAQVKLIRARDATNKSKAKKISDTTARSAAAAHIVADDSKAKVMHKPVKSDGGADDASRRLKFHGKWVNGQNPETVEEYAWVREFTSA
ncbi:MAG: hypothetical protein MK233_03110, partial [Candidatus Poseidoniales archaeon]|nr:hypothetical protein [Candidatus Poseidoniales archaeon]